MAERVPIVPDGLAANPAFSPGVRVGELLFVSGQIAQAATVSWWARAIAPPRPGR